MRGPADILLFEGFRLDRGGLSRVGRDGGVTPVPLGSRALYLLGLLVDRQGELISKDEIMQTVWPQTAVEENNLTVQISALRRILDRDRVAGSCIQTVPGRGYRFIPPVTRLKPMVPQPSLSANDGKAFISANATGSTDAGSLALNTDRPPFSIVVLPFDNLSDDQGQQFFADGVTDDLTTDLSRIAGSFVISHSTAVAYRKTHANVKQIGDELGVRYALEGTVRRFGNKFRVNAHLIDCRTAGNLWAERFDCVGDDLLALQNEVTGRIAVALNLELTNREASRSTENFSTRHYILQGHAALARPRTAANYALAIELFERALTFDSGSTDAQSSIGAALTSRVLDQMTHSAATDIARAKGLIEQALAKLPNSPLAHLAKAQLLREQGALEEAIAEYETVISLDRNWVNAIAALGWSKFLTGSIEEAVDLQVHAIRLSPRDPILGNWYSQIGRVHLLQSRVDEAILWLLRARSVNPAHPPSRAALASAYGLKGLTQHATAELAETRKLAPSGLYSSISRLKTSLPSLSPVFDVHVPRHVFCWPPQGGIAPRVKRRWSAPMARWVLDEITASVASADKAAGAAPSCGDRRPPAFQM